MMRLHRATSETKELNQRLTEALKTMEIVTGQLHDVLADFQQAVEEFRDDRQV